MSKTTVRLSDFALSHLKDMARRRGISLSQLLNEIALQYIGAEEGIRMMEQRAQRGSKAKALAALDKIRQADRPPLEKPLS